MHNKTPAERAARVPTIHIISDSIGETAQVVARAAAAQFGVTNPHLEIFSKVRSFEEVRGYLLEMCIRDRPSTMADLTEDLAGLTDAIVRPLIDEPDALDITAAETEDGNIMVEIRVAADDAGKVIGRQGRVIKSIRTLARAAASKSGKLVDVELID